MSKVIPFVKGWILAMIEGLRYYCCIVRIGWWRRWPFLPLTTRRYLKFRLDTAYGMVENGWKRPPLTKIVVDTKKFLLWRRSMRLETKNRKNLALWTRSSAAEPPAHNR